MCISSLEASKTRLRLLLLYVLALLARPFVPRGSSAPPQRILVIKPDHLGDVLLATPALRALRQALPEAQITLLVGPWAQVALRGNGDVDQLLTLPFPGFERASGAGRGLIAPYLVLLRYSLLLRRGGYDTALVLRDDHWWGAALALLAGVPRRIGYGVAECRPFLSTALPWQPQEHVAVQGLRLVDGLVATGAAPVAPANPFTAEIQRRFPEVPPRSATDSAWAGAWLRQQGVDARSTLVIIHPGTGGSSKHWLPERWCALGNGLLEPSDMGPMRLLITGGPGEEALVAQVAAGISPAPLTLAGCTSIGQLAGLLGRAALVLGVDSGPLHLAVAVGTPTLHLYGPGDHRRFGPWGDPQRHVVLRSGLWCSPCGVFSHCPRSTHPVECMEQITLTQALAAARLLLGNRDAL